jgi:hypothetical protein
MMSDQDYLFVLEGFKYIQDSTISTIALLAAEHDFAATMTWLMGRSPNVVLNSLTKKIKSDFTIARWLISNDHVDAMKEFRNLLLRTDVPVPKLLRLVEIGKDGKTVILCGQPRLRNTRRISFE